MPRSEPVTILVVNEQADEIKLVTLSLRGFFPDCRVEAVYSADEALQWVTRADWDLVLIEERLGLQGHPPLVAALPFTVTSRDSCRLMFTLVCPSASTVTSV